MVNKPILFQIVGYQNSGKTTVIKKIIENLSVKKFKVATIKHHGHGGKPDLVEQKDSSQHLSAGAFVSLVEGEGRILLQAEKDSWSLEEQMKVLKTLEPDYILIEGHKRAVYPKVVIVKNSEDLALLSNLNNIQAVLYWEEDVGVVKSSSYSFPFFKIGSDSGYEWICNYLINQLN